MKNVISTMALAAVLAAGLAAPVLADVDAIATITKTKTVSVVETISIDKDIIVRINVDVDLARAAEAMALVNTTIRNNLVDRDVQNNVLFAGNDNDTLIRTAAITSVGGLTDPGSVSGNTGVTGVNQDVGAMANQGNIWSVALSQDSTPPSLFTDAQAEVDQLNSGNRVSFVDGLSNPPLTTPPTPPVPFGGQVLFTAVIFDSINDNTGLTGVNQNAGNMMNQTNAVAVAAGVTFDGPTQVGGASVALAEAALGQETTGNVVIETTGTAGPGIGTSKLASAIGSINGNTGVTQANQAVGNMGNQGNAVAVGAAVLGL